MITRLGQRRHGRGLARRRSRAADAGRAEADSLDQPRRGGSGILNEVRLARQITHPAVCRVFDVGEAEGEVFYSMELVHGEDLATLLRRVGRLPSEKVVDIGRQLCAGLAAAHAQGVLHRDLKPANVLIDEDGSVRITDFGIAIARSGHRTVTLVGTPGYMAPEQLTPGAPLSEQNRPVRAGRRSCTSCSSDDRPFRPTRARRVGRRSRRRSCPDVDPQLERVILQALAPDPRDRPASAAAMAASLPARPLRPEPAPAAAVARRRPRWRRVVVVLAVLSSWFCPRAARAP